MGQEGEKTELEALRVQIDDLAINHSAGFFEQAREELSGEEPTRGSYSRILNRARELACIAVGEWDAAVNEQAELEELSIELNALAMSTEAGYIAQVSAELEATGITNIGDGEMLSMARSLVHDALGEWAKAVEAQANPQDNSTLPSSFRAVHAVGNVTSATLSEAYNPTPETGRREAFDDELQRIDAAARDGLADLPHIRLD